MSFFSRLFAPSEPPPPPRPPKTMLHPDYWCEIPAGEVQLGLTLEQKMSLWRKRSEVEGYHKESAEICRQTDAALEILKRGETLPAENTGIVRQFWQFPKDEEARIVYIPTFYIYRYPITSVQMLERQKRPIHEIPGTLELIVEKRSWTGKVTRTGCHPCTVISLSEVTKFCTGLHGRLPTADEWEKAARGTDGRLYPWGNEWDETRGFFYSDQPLPSNIIESEITAIDAFPGGASPYGVMAMAGGLPEIVTVPPDTRNSTQFEPGNGETLWLKEKGCHARESSHEYACLDHVVALPGRGDWVSLRPVLDTWPRQQWRGVEVTP